MTRELGILDIGKIFTIGDGSVAFSGCLVDIGTAFGEKIYLFHIHATNGHEGMMYSTTDIAEIHEDDQPRA